MGRFTIPALVVFPGKETRMIYWPANLEDFDVHIPNAAGYAPQPGDPLPALSIRSNVDLEVFHTEMAFDSVTPLYFHGHVESLDADLAPGEYTYKLALGWGGPVLSGGILVIGDYKPADSIQYETPITYEQYQPE